MPKQPGLHARACRDLVTLAGLALLAIMASAPAAAAQAAADSEWRILGLMSENQHFSPLNQINDANIGRLGLAWYADDPTRNSPAGEPLVADGVVYQAGVPSMVWAHDVRTGKLLWSFDAQMKFDGRLIPAIGGRVNRGLALWENNVFVGTGDCRLVAIDRTKGQKAWEADVCEGDAKMMITSAPRVGGGKVFIGPSNADDGTRRGFLDAYDANTGKRLWRFYTIPGDPAKGFENKAMAAAAKTWGKEYWKRTGGASAWDTGTYDPKLNLFYFGTSSAIPDAPVDRGEGRGDELYAASVIAVNADTGEYVWHYQETPNNAWNYDSCMPITIAELPIGGVQRRVLLHAPKNGFFYVIDARTGKLISGDKYGPRVTWAAGIDAKSGRPIELPQARYWESGRVVAYPNGAGAHGVQAMAFSPLTGLTYIPALDMGTVITYLENPPVAASIDFALSAGKTRIDFSGQETVPDAKTALVAWDPVARKARWKLDEPLPWGSGTLATAGNLVFYGKGRLLRAMAADSGRVLWSSEVPGGSFANPITVQVDGEQLVLFAIGNNGTSGLSVSVSGPLMNDAAIRIAPSRLLAFKLDGKVSLPVTDLNNVYPQPPLPRFSKDMEERGRAAMLRHGCDYCHGGEYWNAVGSIPDLRKSSAATHAALDQIVIGGALIARGMPDYSYLPKDDLKLIQAWIINAAWAAYDAQNPPAD